MGVGVPVSWWCWSWSLGNMGGNSGKGLARAEALIWGSRRHGFCLLCQTSAASSLTHQAGPYCFPQAHR